MSEAIERATDAVILAWYPQASVHRVVSPKIYNEARLAVLATLKAIREPTAPALAAAECVEMRCACDGDPTTWYPDDAAIWRAMIDALLATDGGRAAG